MGLIRYYFLPGKTLFSISSTPDASKIKFDQIIDADGNKKSFIIKRNDLVPVEKGFHFGDGWWRQNFGDDLKKNPP